jgi:exonuclease III
MKVRIVQINAWKSKYPMEILMGTFTFDIICLQEPWAKEADSFKHTGYYLITPNCAPRHRVSIYVREAAIPAANIVPHPDLSTSPDILVVDFILHTRKISLINLCNDCKTRAGVGLIDDVLHQLPSCADTLALMDSNSHHILWDSNTSSRQIDVDFDLHDVLVSRPLMLITLPDVPTHLPSGNLIDLGWASPSLLGILRDVQVEEEMGLGSDHLPITYSCGGIICISFLGKYHQFSRFSAACKLNSQGKQKKKSD